MSNNSKPSVLITGAGGGLGRRVMERVIATGEPVVAVTGDIQSEAFTSIPNKDFSRLSVYQCDVLSSIEVKKLIDKLCEHDLAKIFICHGGSNVSSNDPGSIYEDLDVVLRLNFESIVQLIEGLLSQLIISRAKICIVSSISGVESHGNPAYSAAKAALIAYTRSFGRYVSRLGVSMYCVSPGAFLVEGGYWDKIRISEKARFNDFCNNRMAIGRIGDLDEIVDFVITSLNAATPYVAGNNFIYDGGQGRLFVGD